MVCNVLLLSPTADQELFEGLLTLRLNPHCDNLWCLLTGHNVSQNFRTKCPLSLICKPAFSLFSRSQSAAETMSHPSILISDDEEPPQLTKQLMSPDANGNTSAKNNNATESDPPRAPSMDMEIKELLNGVAARLMPDAVGQVAVRSTTKSKSMEFNAKLMGLSMPDLSSQNKAWKEHPIIKLGREEVNSKFSEMVFGPESEKRMGCPPPAQPAKMQTVAAADTLSGSEMTKLPHVLRTEIPAGAKIETVEIKSKLPRVVEEESTAILWNSVRKFPANKIFNQFVSSIYATNLLDLSL